MQVIYIDTLFLINLIINYLILLTTAKICASPAPRARLAASAALGGVYAAAAAIPPLAFLQSPPVIAAIGLLLVTAAFFGQERIARLALVFFAVSAAFAGAILAVSLLFGGGLYGGFYTPLSFKTLCISFAVCYAVITLVFRGTAGNKGGIVGLTIRHSGREITLRALVDTGNTLRDPMTGLPVIITYLNNAKPLLPGELHKTVGKLAQKDAVSVLEELSGISGTMRFQLIPYSAIGISSGMLLAFRPDTVLVNGTAKTGTLIALSPTVVSDNGTYSALIGA